MRDVPALHIRHITAALARSGRVAEARLIAAEVAIRASGRSAGRAAGPA
jgi:hypothetical protein